MNGLAETQSQSGVTVSAPLLLEPWLEKIIDRPLTMTVLPVSRKAARATLAKIRNYLEPAGAKAAAVLLVNKLACYQQPENLDELMEVLVREMARLPVPLVQLAIRRHQQECPWFPKPSELGQNVAPEICRLRLAEWKLTQMLEESS